MGRRNKAYYKDLHQQAYDKLVGMQAFGESKRAAVVAGTDKEKIFSFNTYKSYWKHTKYFIQYIKEHHPECTTLKSARKYVNEWLQARADQGLSAWTVQLEAKAMGKLYGISPDDENYFKPPKRNREDIKRSRGDRVRDRHFSKTNNDELIKFCKGTGLRRSELAELRGKDLVTRAQIEAEISSLESRPTAELTPADVKRLGMLQDAPVVPGGVFYPREERKRRQRAPEPHYRPKCGADRPEDTGDAGRGKGMAARPPERRYSRLPGRVCNGHLQGPRQGNPGYPLRPDKPWDGTPVSEPGLHLQEGRGRAKTGQGGHAGMQ